MRWLKVKQTLLGTNELVIIITFNFICMCFRKKKPGLQRITKERLRQLTAVSELATTEYTIVKVVKANDVLSLFKGKIGDRKLLYSCNVYVKAGINLEDYDPKKTDIKEVEKSITVVLPHAKVLSFNMPAEECELAYEKVGPLRSNFKQGEKNELLIQGEESVREQMNSMGILEDAERNAKDIFKAALLQVGYTDIDIKFE